MPAVIKERKGVLIECVTYMQQIVIVLLAVILHKQNIEQVSCKTGTIIKRSMCHSSIRLLALNSPLRLNEHILDEHCMVVHVN